MACVIRTLAASPHTTNGAKASTLIASTGEKFFGIEREREREREREKGIRKFAELKTKNNEGW